MYFWQMRFKILELLYNKVRFNEYCLGMKIRENNYVFIDGQNLYIGAKVEGLFIDYKKLKIYLKDKYSVNKIFYFWGYYKNENKKIYEKLNKLEYIQIFKEHAIEQVSQKKGNIDSNLVFEIMKKIISKECFNKIVLVSGDGDYKKLVNYLIQKNRFKKLLFPSYKSLSYLYKSLRSERCACLSDPEIKSKIEIIK
jgi:hypothetical protein